MTTDESYLTSSIENMFCVMKKNISDALANDKMVFLTVRERSERLNKI